MKNIESLSCDVSNGMVYVYDQDGCFFDSYSYPDIENAYSIGRGIVIETESMIYTYSLCGNYLKCTGSRSRLGGCKPPSDDLRAKDANRTEQDHGSSSDYTPSRSYGGGSGGSPGCLFAFIIFAILYCLIYQKGCSHNEGDRPTTATRHEYTGARKDIKEFIAKHNACRVVAITKTEQGGDVAIVGDNGYACTAKCPSDLIDRLKKMHDESHRITDVCLTDKGRWVVLEGRNGFWSSKGIPTEMYNWMFKFHDDKEALLSVTVNDKGDWAVISDKHFISSSTEIQNLLDEGMAKYGNPLSVSITDDAGAAVFKRGFYWWGNCPKDMVVALQKLTYTPRIIRMAGTSWFFADETGSRYNYSM